MGRSAGARVSSGDARRQSGGGVLPASARCPILKVRSPYKALDQLTALVPPKKLEEMAREIELSIRINRIGVDVDAVLQQRSRRRSSQRPALQPRAAENVLSSDAGDAACIFTPSAFETAFLTTAHTKAVLKKALAAIEKSFKKLPGS